MIYKALLIRVTKLPIFYKEIKIKGLYNIIYTRVRTHVRA